MSAPKDGVICATSPGVQNIGSGVALLRASYLPVRAHMPIIKHCHTADDCHGAPFSDIWYVPLHTSTNTLGQFSSEGRMQSYVTTEPTRTSSSLSTKIPALISLCTQLPRHAMHRKMRAPLPSVGVCAAKGARPGRSTGDSSSCEEAGIGGGGCGEKDDEENCGETAWGCCAETAVGEARRLSLPIIEPKPSSLSRVPLLGLCTSALKHQSLLDAASLSHT